MFTFQNDDAKLAKVMDLLKESPRVADIKNFRTLAGSVGHVRNLFIGDSITSSWPLHEFFPNHSIINRGIGSDNAFGIYFRLDVDVFPYQPERVFILSGINGISDETDLIVNNLGALAEIIQSKGSKVFLSSILPLRDVEGNVRFYYQDKVLEINQRLKAVAADNGFGFLDYHAALKDETGQLDVRYAREDGLHVIFEGYRVMSSVVAPYLI